MILFTLCGAIIGCVLALYSLNFVEDLVGRIGSLSNRLHLGGLYASPGILQVDSCQMPC